MWFSTTFKGFLSSCMSFELVFKRKLSIYSTTAAAAAASERESSFDFGLYIFMFEWAFRLFARRCPLSKYSSSVRIIHWVSINGGCVICDTLCFSHPFPINFDDEKDLSSSDPSEGRRRVYNRVEAVGTCFDVICSAYWCIKRDDEEEATLSIYNLFSVYSRTDNVRS